MDALLGRVRHRLTEPSSDRPFNFEEQLLWECQKAQIEYLAYSKGYQELRTVPPAKVDEAKKQQKAWAAAQPHADRMAQYEAWEED